MINVIGKKYIYLTVSALLVAASIFSIASLGVKSGIDFAGGVAWQLRFSQNIPDKEQLAEIVPQAVITPQSGGQFLLRFPDLAESAKEELLSRFEKNYGSVEEMQFQDIGPSVGADLRQKAIWAFALVLAAISLYVAFAFRKVSRPVSSWKYGAITLITLFHDALIPAGLYAVLGRLVNAEVDTNFIVAILVVMGFSVHDTIVVSDRVRENLRLHGSSADFKKLVNDSVNQTLARSINTSLTLVLTLFALLLFGPAALQYFILTILVGVIVGTYSSIFVASPLLVIFQRK